MLWSGVHSQTKLVVNHVHDSFSDRSRRGCLCSRVATANGRTGAKRRNVRSSVAPHAFRRATQTESPSAPVETQLTFASPARRPPVGLCAEKIFRALNGLFCRVNNKAGQYLHGSRSRHTRTQSLREASDRPFDCLEKPAR